MTDEGGITLDQVDQLVASGPVALAFLVSVLAYLLVAERPSKSFVKRALVVGMTAAILAGVVWWPALPSLGSGAASSLMYKTVSRHLLALGYFGLGVFGEPVYGH